MIYNTLQFAFSYLYPILKFAIFQKCTTRNLRRPQNYGIPYNAFGTIEKTSENNNHVLRLYLMVMLKLFFISEAPVA